MWCYVMELFPGNIDFAADNRGALSCCFFIVCETMFTMGESPAISHANDTEQEAQQVLEILDGEDFPPKLLFSLFIESRSKKTTEKHGKHRLGQRR